MTDLLNDIGKDIANELVDAVYVVADVLDVDALTAIDHRAVLAGAPGYGLGFVLGVQASDVVLVGDVDSIGWHSMLTEMAPHVRVRVLPGVRSAALALGHRLDIDYDLPTIETKRATWAALVADARIADLQREVERSLVERALVLDLPAVPMKLKLRRARR